MGAKVIGLLAAFSVLPTVASAQDARVSESVRGQGWSTTGGTTVGESATALTVQAGFPGLSVGLLHGLSSRVDLGARFTFNYGVEGMVNAIAPGLKLQGVLRASLLNSGRASLGLEFAPGPLSYFYGGYAVPGMALPVSLTAGFPVGSALQLNAGLDLPMWVSFGGNGAFMMPILAGVGVEYFLERNVAVTFNLKMGPTIASAYPYPTYAYFTMNALFGLAYRL